MHNNLVLLKVIFIFGLTKLPFGEYFYFFWASGRQIQDNNRVLSMFVLFLFGSFCGFFSVFFSRWDFPRESFCLLFVFRQTKQSTKQTLQKIV